MEESKKTPPFARFSAYMESVRRLRLDDAQNSLALSRRTRLSFALLPLCAFLVVVFQLQSAAREETLVDAAGVRRLADVSWEAGLHPVPAGGAEACLATRCWEGATPRLSAAALALPDGDPLGSGAWEVTGDAVARYATRLDAKLLKGLATPVLYLPGLRAGAVSVFVDGRLAQTGFGGLPVFVSLPKGGTTGPVTVEVALAVAPRAGYQGFIKVTPFVGDALNVYRAHHALEFRSFPRHAAVVFLLAIAAVTLCFFIFLDHQRELLALSVALSLLGLAQAVRVGVLPFFGTEAFVALNAWFFAFLAWFALEHFRLNKAIPYLLLASPLAFVGVRAAAGGLGAEAEKTVKEALAYALVGVPFLLGFLALAVAPNVWRASPRRARAILAAGCAFLLYGVNLLGLEIGHVGGIVLSRHFESLTLACVAVWVTAALSSLGTLEERVAKSREDARERAQLEHELHLAQEVQEAFIPAGPQASDAFEVATIYKAARKVGGDWLCWRELGDGYSLAIVGDVVGKGVQAGLVVAACDGVLAQALANMGPVRAGGEEQAVREVVKALVRGVFAGRPRRAMTGLFMLAHASGRVWVASVGHLPLVGIKGGEARLVATRNPWLNGQLDADALAVAAVGMRPGELFVGFTDGVCTNSRELRRLVTAWSHWDREAMPELIRRFNGFEPHHDDVSIMMLRAKEPA